MKSMVIAALSLFLASASVLAQDGIRRERVQFKQDETGTTLKGRIKGHEIVDYVVRGKTGQSMIITLNTDSPSNYFNVTAPGEDSAMFIGSTAGNRFEGDLPKSGDYAVRVYLMRNAARRNEVANYSLNIHIGDGHDAGPAGTGGGDYADENAGGPDFLEVTGVPGGDTLNMRAGPSTREHVVGELGNGTIVRNLGCKTSGGQRWCRVARPEDPEGKGWVAGRYLRESSYRP